MRAIAVENSENAKLGLVSATYSGQGSCPGRCPFLGCGCYAELGPLGITTRRLNREGGSPRQIALEEAAAIDRLSGDRPLRLHVVGDAKTAETARILGRACSRYRNRGATAFRGKKVWTYTHAWRNVPRAAWGASVSVLASVESPWAARKAMEAGYAVAIVVPWFDGERAQLWDGLTVIPCPWQTRGVQCRDCRLCWNDERLLNSGLAIGFAPHGAKKRFVASLL